MSIASIIHVGSDDCDRIDVFRNAGYLVSICISFDQLHSALIGIPRADAVSVVESPEDLSRRAASLTRATTSIPLILFQSASRRFDEADFDLVIPPVASPQAWISEVQRLIDESRSLRARSQAIRAKSEMLRQASRTLREQISSIEEKLRLQLERSETEAARNREETRRDGRD